MLTGSGKARFFAMYASNIPLRGFIALISVFIISFVFLVAIISLGQFGLTGRLLLVTSENKIKSEEYAEACVQVARILVVNDLEREHTNRTIQDGELACTIVAVEPDEPSSGESTIKSRAEVAGAVTNFVVVVHQTTHAIESWKEEATMP